jgi:hypothetical protein
MSACFFVENLGGFLFAPQMVEQLLSAEKYLEKGQNFDSFKIHSALFYFLFFRI